MDAVQYLRRTTQAEDVVSRALNVELHPATAGNRSSVMDENVNDSRWGQDSDVVFLLFLLFIFIGLLFMAIRMHCSWRRRVRNGGDLRMYVTAEDGRRHSLPSRPRSQSFIEKLLVLKTVFGEPSDDEKQLDKSRGHKSNIMIQKDTKDDDHEKLSCSICLCDYEDGDQICWSNNAKCNHHFHADCGIAWLAKHSECPICRAEYLVSPEDVKVPDSKQQDKAAAPEDRDNDGPLVASTNNQEVQAASSEQEATTTGRNETTSMETVNLGENPNGEDDGERPSTSLSSDNV